MKVSSNRTVLSASPSITYMYCIFVLHVRACIGEIHSDEEEMEEDGEKVKEGEEEGELHAVK